MAEAQLSGRVAAPQEPGATGLPGAAAGSYPSGAPPGAPSGGPAVVLDRVTVRRGNRLVLNEVSAEIPPSSFTGLVGPNGGGKTTLLQVILGLIRPGAGSVRVLGVDPARSPGVRRQIGYLAQFPRHDPLFPVSAADVVEMGALARLRGPDPGGPPPPRAFPDRARSEARDASRQALELIGLWHLAPAPFGRLSGGQRQLVLLARAIAGRPRLLLLDEPLTGLDQQHRAGFYSLVDRLRRETGVTVVAVCHDFRALLPHAERLLCLDGSLHVHREAGGPPPEWAALDGRERCLFDAIFQGRSPAG